MLIIVLVVSSGRVVDYSDSASILWLRLFVHDLEEYPGEKVQDSGSPVW
jgi:hypothetical protein